MRSVKAVEALAELPGRSSSVATARGAAFR